MALHNNTQQKCFGFVTFSEGNHISTTFKHSISILLILLVLLIFHTSSVRSSITLSNSTCSKSTQFFDSSSMFCKDCSTNEVSTDGLYCYCNEGYKLTFTTSSKTCELCTFASSRDRSICMTCGPSTLGFDSTLKDCKCNGTSKLVEIDAGGNFLSAKQCISCGSKSIPHPSNRYLCSSCPDPLMQASTDGTSCVCPSSHQLVSLKRYLNDNNMSLVV